MMKLNFIFGLIFVVFTGCSSGGSGDAMPITQDNINEYAKKMSTSAKAVSMGDSNVKKAIQIYKVPLEDMGYDFDATIINTIKVIQNAGYTALSTTTMKIILPILHMVNENPELVVEDGLILEDTRDKILMYNKFHEMNTDTIQALKYVEECQNDNGGICTIKQYVSILLDEDFVSPHENFEKKDLFSQLSADNIFNQKNNDCAYHFSSRFDDKVKYREFGKFLVYKNGKKVNANGFIEDYRKPFKLKDGTIEQLKNYNPWWLK